MSPRLLNNVKSVLSTLDKKIKKDEKDSIISFEQFLSRAQAEPHKYFRNVFQLFSNMIYHYVAEEDEYETDPENIKYKTIDCDRLLVDNTNTPFFADLPLANRLLRFADSFKEGAQQNKIYVFIGPPGSGKSTFLNNLLIRFQEYSQSSEGITYEVLWRLEDEQLGPNIAEDIKEALKDYYSRNKVKFKDRAGFHLDVPCPNHDHPILAVPREHRKDLLEQIIHGEDRIKIFNKKEYEWVFKQEPCTICQSIYQALIKRLESPTKVFSMLFARRYVFDRRLGKGISVYNPGDNDPEKLYYVNTQIQRELSQRFKDSEIVKYIYSKYASTNDGVYVLMDVKGNNEKRFLDLHGIISEGTHKIEEIEENVSSLFLAVMNPEDKDKILKLKSFKDRITEINVNYILNYMAEVKIYYNAFGAQIKNKFLPGVLNNFAKIIISSRLDCNSEAMKEWIKDYKKYSKYCDEDLLLLKLSIFNNKIPSWLTEEDYKNFDRNVRRKIVNESEREGRTGFSGRESINIFNEFYNEVRKRFSESNGKKRSVLITMEDLKNFFNKKSDYFKRIPKGFIDSIIRLYNYNVMQQIKKSLFHQNEERISKDIQNYLFATNYDIGEKQICPYTGEQLEITDAFFEVIEQNLFDKKVDGDKRKEFRNDIASRFTISLQSMQADDSEITNTPLYNELYNNYMKNLRENIFQPFLQYTSFENAIKEYGTSKLDVFDERTKEQVTFLLQNLEKNFGYSKNGAQQVCLYVLNNKIAETFKE